MHDVGNETHRKEICKWCLKLFEPCLDPNGSGRELSMFDKLDVRHREPPAENVEQDSKQRPPH